MEKTFCAFCDFDDDAPVASELQAFTRRPTIAFQTFRGQSAPARCNADHLSWGCSRDC
jgi:hypothetical protein